MRTRPPSLFLPKIWWYAEFYVILSENATNMKKVLIALLTVGLLTVPCSCKKEKKSDDIIATKYEVKRPKAPIRMEEKKDSKNVQWVGRSYTLEILRMPDDSLAYVQDETGQKFVDNRITLRIIRTDGSVFFQRTFVKQTFSSCLDDDYRKTGILEGLVLDKVDGSQLVFAASVCHPQTDEYIPLSIMVDNFGNVSVKRDDYMDTFGNEPKED